MIMTQFTTTMKRKYNRLSLSDREDLYDLYKEGTTIKELSEMYDISRATVSNIINTFKKAEPVATIVKPVEEPAVEEKEEEESEILSYDEYKSRLKKKTMKKEKRRGNHAKTKKSKNAHQVKKEIQFSEPVIKQPTTPTPSININAMVAANIKEKKVENSNDFSSLIPGIISSLDLKKVEIPTSTLEVGLVADRHAIIGIDTFIFDNIDSDLMFDYDKQLEIAEQFITSRLVTGQTLICYCTGLQSPLVSVFRVCNEHGINLICKHYDSDWHNYKSQIAIKKTESIEDSFIFSRLIKKGNIYLYNCTYNDIINIGSEKFVTLSFNEHEDADMGFKNSMYIILKNDSDMWNVYPQIYNIVKENTDKRLSVLMAHMHVEEGVTLWDDNICKSYNFK